MDCKTGGLCETINPVGGTKQIVGAHCMCPNKMEKH